MKPMSSVLSNRGPFEHDSAVVTPFRKLYCEDYDDCLDIAIKSKLVTWHCFGCTEYVECSSDQKYSDMLALLKLTDEINCSTKRTRAQKNEEVGED